MKTETKANLNEDVEVMKEEKAVVAPAVELNEGTINKWKAQYGKIFRSIIDGDIFIWRKLKRKEYVELMSIRSEGENGLYDRQEAITKLCTLWPVDLTELMDENGGLATSISDEVLRKSGFDIEATEEL